MPSRTNRAPPGTRGAFPRDNWVGFAGESTLLWAQPRLQLGDGGELASMHVLRRSVLSKRW